MTDKKMGFAAMTEEKRLAAQRKGGIARTAGLQEVNFASNPQRASEAGKKGAAKRWNKR